MGEQIGQELKVEEAVETNTELGEHFRFIGKLAREAAADDKSANLMLGILHNQQLAEIRNLELELQVSESRRIARIALNFMVLPKTPSQK